MEANKNIDPMTIVIPAAQMRRAKALAMGYGHTWGGTPDESELNTAQAIQEYWNRLAEEYNTEGWARGIESPGIMPDGSIGHTSGTGSRSWLVNPDGSVEIEIHRPAWPGRYPAGSVCVLAAKVGAAWDNETGTLPVSVRRENPEVPVHARHLAYLAEAIGYVVAADAGLPTPGYAATRALPYAWAEAAIVAAGISALPDGGEEPGYNLPGYEQARRELAEWNATNARARELMELLPGHYWHDRIFGSTAGSAAWYYLGEVDQAVLEEAKASDDPDRAVLAAARKHIRAAEEACFEQAKAELAAGNLPVEESEYY